MQKVKLFDSPSVPPADGKNIPQWTRHICSDVINVLFFNGDDLHVLRMDLKAKMYPVLIPSDLNRTKIGFKDTLV